MIAIISRCATNLRHDKQTNKNKQLKTIENYYLSNTHRERRMRFSPVDFPLVRFFDRLKPINSFSASLQLELDELRDEMNVFSGTLRC